MAQITQGVVHSSRAFCRRKAEGEHDDAVERLQEGGQAADNVGQHLPRVHRARDDAAVRRQPPAQLRCERHLRCQIRLTVPGLMCCFASPASALQGGAAAQNCILMQALCRERL